MLVSREHEAPLTLAERFWLRLHLFVCAGCRNFRNNMVILRTALTRYLEDGSGREK